MTQDANRDTAGPLESLVEYTHLRKTLTHREIETMCSEAVALGFGAVVVPTGLVRLASSCLTEGTPVVASVLSHPFGTQAPVVKMKEAEIAVAEGAAALDVVPHFGAILAERWPAVREELKAVRSVTGNVPLTLVLETGRLKTPWIRQLCAIAADIGYSFVANTVGFRLVSTDPEAEGRATPEIIQELHGLAGVSLGVKAVGGITTRAQAEELHAAGARRFSVEASPSATESGAWNGPVGGET